MIQDPLRLWKVSGPRNDPQGYSTLIEETRQSPRPTMVLSSGVIVRLGKVSLTLSTKIKCSVKTQCRKANLEACWWLTKCGICCLILLLLFQYLFLLVLASFQGTFWIDDWQAHRPNRGAGDLQQLHRWDVRHTSVLSVLPQNLSRKPSPSLPHPQQNEQNIQRHSMQDYFCLPGPKVFHLESHRCCQMLPASDFAMSSDASGMYHIALLLLAKTLALMFRGS